jgi:ligand-binding SRPBCC domain-containing protein
MTTIHLTTFIEAPIERVFDLSRSIDLHKKSMSHTREEAIAGTTSGLIELDQTVTWKAKHLMKTRFLKSKITSMNRPHSFTDEQVVGDFKNYRHEHHFKQVKNGTIVIDFFHFETPYGKAGLVFNQLYLKRYITNLIEQRNHVIKQYAESDKWKYILNKF